MIDMPNEDADTDYWDASDLVSKSNANKIFKVRRYICRVCKMKFRTRKDTQAHLNNEHRKIKTKGQ